MPESASLQRISLTQLSLVKVQKADGECYHILCDAHGLASYSIDHYHWLIHELQQTIQALSEQELDRYSKEALLKHTPHMFPQIYDRNDPLWQEYQRNHPPEPSRKPPKKAGIVYALKGDTCYKIGCTTNLTKRLRALGIKSPFPLTIVALLQTENIYALERELHYRFAAKRRRGEWFDLSDEDIVTLQQHACVVDPSTYNAEVE